MTSPLVSIGLVTWNSAGKLADTLMALSGQSYARFELIAIDNASRDDSMQAVHVRFPTAKTVCNTENLGYSGGHNQAIRLARGEYYLALNPDVVMGPDYLAFLVGALEDHPEYGSAAGKLMREPGVIDSTGLFINRRRQQYIRGHGQADQGQYETPGEVFGVDGAAPLYRRGMLDDIREGDDYFDHDFFAYKEDVDLAWRARWLGWRTWYEPRAVAMHRRTFQPGNRAVNPRIRFYSVRNRYLLLMKNESREGWRRDALPITFYDLQIASYLLVREPRSLKAITAAYAFRNRMREKHATLMSRRRIPPAAMLEWFR